MSEVKSLKEAIDFVDNFDGLKKVVYSFRCNPTVLASLSDYARINNTTLPKLINTILYDFVSNNVESFECKRYDVKYLQLPIVEKTMYLDEELKSVQKQVDELTQMLINLKNEMNREFLKRIED